jgi:F0F1-type ATP synthase delta subunit
MKKSYKKNELDVDFIQSKPLTKKEQQALSEFIKKLKNKKRIVKHAA